MGIPHHLASSGCYFHWVVIVEDSACSFYPIEMFFQGLFLSAETLLKLIFHSDLVSAKGLPLIL